jgi:hypothetical protein
MEKKFDRKRALNAKLIRESKSNPGYYKYEITIGDVDGSEKVVPSYGVDMMDALERLMWKERSNKLESTISRAPSWMLAVVWLLLTVVGPGLTTMKTESALPILISFAVNSFIAAGYLAYKNWEEKN